jgi:RNA polymerase sigma-70 factor (ECF subfamily)
MSSEHQPGSQKDADKLVARARTDRDSFGQLYDRYYDRIYRHCVRRAFQRCTAEELCSDVFVYVASHMWQFRGTTEREFRGWIYGIATNTINAHFRRTRRRDELFRHAIEMDALRVADAGRAVEAEFDELDFGRLHQAIAQLQLRDQAIVTLRYFDGLSFDEVAAAVAMRPGTARVASSRALDRLRRLLARHEPNKPAPDRRNA